MGVLETDPLDWAIDPLTDDLATGPDGGLYFATGLAGIAQLARQAILSFKGEWFLDLDSGVPWMTSDTVTEAQAILGNRFDELLVRAAVRDALLTTPGVLAINKLEASLDASTRSLSIVWSVSTVFGDTPPDSLPVGA